MRVGRVIVHGVLGCGPSGRGSEGSVRREDECETRRGKVDGRDKSLGLPLSCTCSSKPMVGIHPGQRGSVAGEEEDDDEARRCRVAARGPPGCEVEGCSAQAVRIRGAMVSRGLQLVTPLPPRPGRVEATTWTMSRPMTLSFLSLLVSLEPS